MLSKEISVSQILQPLVYIFVHSTHTQCIYMYIDLAIRQISFPLLHIEWVLCGALEYERCCSCLNIGNNICTCEGLYICTRNLTVIHDKSLKGRVKIHFSKKPGEAVMRIIVQIFPNEQKQYSTTPQIGFRVRWRN